jgi:hypothetical protein
MLYFSTGTIDIFKNNYFGNVISTFSINGYPINLVNNTFESLSRIMSLANTLDDIIVTDNVFKNIVSTAGSSFITATSTDLYFLRNTVFQSSIATMFNVLGSSSAESNLYVKDNILNIDGRLVNATGTTGFSSFIVDNNLIELASTVSRSDLIAAATIIGGEVRILSNNTIYNTSASALTAKVCQEFNNTYNGTITFTIQSGGTDFVNSTQSIDGGGA